MSRYIHTPLFATRQNAEVVKTRWKGGIPLNLRCTDTVPFHTLLSKFAGRVSIFGVLLYRLSFLLVKKERITYYNRENEKGDHRT